LTVTAGFLLAVFDGITDRLIPLFAIGAFLTFTMSQSGMVAHWRKKLAQAPKPKSGAASWSSSARATASNGAVRDAARASDASSSQNSPRRLDHHSHDSLRHRPACE